tara:strand:- start:70 stop:213 length:144 start_codon:yes stop_codon:yes gene_type:complete
MNERDYELTKTEEKQIRQLVNRWIRMKVKRDIKRLFKTKRKINATTR